MKNPKDYKFIYKDKEGRLLFFKETKVLRIENTEIYSHDYTSQSCEIWKKDKI